MVYDIQIYSYYYSCVVMQDLEVHSLCDLPPELGLSGYFMPRAWFLENPLGNIF